MNYLMTFLPDPPSAAIREAGPTREEELRALHQHPAWIAAQSDYTQSTADPAMKHAYAELANRIEWVLLHTHGASPWAEDLRAQIVKLVLHEEKPVKTMCDAIDQT